MSQNEIDQLIKEKFTNRFCKGYSTHGKSNVFVTMYFKDYAKRIEDFQVYDSDIFVITFPKSGTTWAQEMVWLIFNDLDYEGAKVYLSDRFRFLEIASRFDPEEMEKEGLLTESYRDSVAYVEKAEHPRFIKSHLPYSLLPKQIQNGTKKPKIIYVMRNPKDVCTSYYYHVKSFPLGTPATIEEFAKIFLADKVPFAPFWSHILEFWERRNDSNILILRYEDMKKDLPSVVNQVAQFFNKQLTDNQIQKLVQHLSFDSMKENDAVNYKKPRKMREEKGLLRSDVPFMRSGTVGQYKEELTQDTIKKLDEWTKKNIQGTDFEQYYVQDRP